MWLEKDIKQICLKEFQLRHQLDIIQDNPYISYNIQQIRHISFELPIVHRDDWPTYLRRSNFYLSNIIEYFKLFQPFFGILRQGKVIKLFPIVLRGDNITRTIQERLQSFSTLLEVCRTIAYRGSLQNPLRLHQSFLDLFHSLQGASVVTDPPGERLLALGNRRDFIKLFLEKLIWKHTESAHSFTSILSPLSETGNHTPSSSSDKDHTVSSDTITNSIATTALDTRLRPRCSVSTSKQRKIRRLSELLRSQSDSDSSCDSSASIWKKPFENA